MTKTLALAGLLFGAAGCASAPPARRDFVHPASSRDGRLLEALEAVPEGKDSTILERVLKTPLVVPTLAAAAVRDTPRALAAFALTPVALVEGLLEAAGILPPDPEPPPVRPSADP